MKAPSLLARIDQTHVPMLLARLVLGGVFVYLAVMKLQDPFAFLKNIRQYELFPTSPPYFINMTAVALPWIEILCGLFLIAGFWIRASGAIVLAMLLAFTPAILVRTIGVYNAGGIAFCDIAFDCGCGTGEIVICKKLAENIALMLLAVITITSKSRRFGLESLPVPADQR